MPDLTDRASQQLTELAKEYARTGPSRITDEDWHSHLVNSAPAKEIRKLVSQLSLENAEQMLAQHLIRDGIKRAKSNVRRSGTRAVEAYFLAEQRGVTMLWEPGTFKFIGAGVFTINGHNDGDFDVPLPHLRLRIAADELARRAKDQTAKWSRISVRARYVLDLGRDELPADTTLASAVAERIYQELQSL